MVGSIGSLVLDVTIAPAGQLRLDDDRDASIKIGGGGQAANFCAWSAALGEGSRLITRVGDDELGRRLVAEIEAGGVEVKAVLSKDPTGAIAVLLSPTGERTFARQERAVQQGREQYADRRSRDRSRILRAILDQAWIGRRDEKPALRDPRNR